MTLFRPGVLFWTIVLVGLAPFFLRYRSLTPPSKAFIAWDRQVIAIRLAEWVTILFYLGTVYYWRWSLPLTSHARAAAVAGLAVTAAGAALASWSKVVLGDFFSTTLGVKKDHQVITSGPYRWVRHPIYTGLLLVVVGGALVYDSGTALLLLAVPFCAFFYWQSVLEEKLLVNHLGEAYLQYRSKTGRLLPRFPG